MFHGIQQDDMIERLQLLNGLFVNLRQDGPGRFAHRRSLPAEIFEAGGK
jgi:hypothetical protein